MSASPAPWGSIPFGGPLTPIKVSDILYRAYRIAGIITEAGRGYSRSQERDGLNILNSMVDQWRTQRLMVWAILRSIHPLEVNKQAYLIGTDSQADWNIERPEKIEKAGLMIPASTYAFESPLDVLTIQQWAAVTTKELTSTLSQYLYYEATVPNGTAWMWPIPTLAYSVALYTWQHLQEFQGADDELAVPPGYRKALEYGLAVDLADNFPTRQKLSQLAMQKAAQSIGWLKAANSTPLLQQVDLAALGKMGDRLGHFSIFSNSYIR